MSHAARIPMLLLATIVLAACTSSAPGPRAAATPASPPVTAAPAAAAPAEDVAWVTVYREKRILGAALNTSVHVDGVEVADLDPGTYVTIALEPGSHRFWADEKRDELSLELVGGRQYYFRMELVPGMWKGHGRLTAVGEDVGAGQMAEWRPKLAKHIRTPEIVVGSRAQSR